MDKIHRGKRIDNDNWVEGTLVNIANNKLKYAIRTYDWKDFEVQEKTIGIFSNFHDSSGKRIFEGDILGMPICSLAVNRKLYVFGIVVFNDPYFTIRWKDNRLSKELIEDSKYLEVVGNIYDNKELLE